MNNSASTNYLAPVEEREGNRYANMMLPLFCLTIRYWCREGQMSVTQHTCWQMCYQQGKRI